ncbi:MAG: hypothetical protein ACI9DO_003484, partial [Reinekea sp.]
NNTFRLSAVKKLRVGLMHNIHKTATAAIRLGI